MTRPTAAPRPAAGQAAAPGGAAGRLAPLAAALFGGTLPVRIRAWDGSEAGPGGTPVLVLRSRRALRRLLWHPGELGLAQAYVAGELDVDGDLTEGLRAAWQASAGRGTGDAGPAPRWPLPPSRWAQAAVTAVALGLPGPRPPAPASQVQVSGRVHSRSRDRAVIARHYDLPPAFYQLILDESMAYSCAWWGAPGAGPGLAGAQRAKLGKIAGKLRLRPGGTLLDIGCGWGSLALHAAREYGARVTAVTLAGEQAAFVRERAAAAGLSGQIEVRHQDYRELTAGEYDAVASVEMGEHVGAGQYPAFCALLAARVRPGGRVLMQQMSRAAGAAPGGGAFIEAFITPDMHMRPAAETAGLLAGAGLELLGTEAMREHYPPTIRAWLGRLEENRAAVESLAGPELARVWRLYLAGSALAFESGRMGVDQFLLARPGPPAGQ